MDFAFKIYINSQYKEELFSVYCVEKEESHGETGTFF